MNSILDFLILQRALPNSPYRSVKSIHFMWVSRIESVFHSWYPQLSKLNQEGVSIKLFATCSTASGGKKKQNPVSADIELAEVKSNGEGAASPVTVHVQATPREVAAVASSS